MPFTGLNILCVVWPSQLPGDGGLLGINIPTSRKEPGAQRGSPPVSGSGLESLCQIPQQWPNWSPGLSFLFAIELLLTYKIICITLHLKPFPISLSRWWEGPWRGTSQCSPHCTGWSLLPQARQLLVFSVHLPSSLLTPASGRPGCWWRPPAKLPLLWLWAGAAFWSSGQGNVWNAGDVNRTLSPPSSWKSPEAWAVFVSKGWAAPWGPSSRAGVWVLHSPSSHLGPHLLGLGCCWERGVAPPPVSRWRFGGDVMPLPLSSPVHLRGLMWLSAYAQLQNLRGSEATPCGWSPLCLHGLVHPATHRAALWLNVCVWGAPGPWGLEGI